MNKSETVRHALRTSTAAAHEQLDSGMAGLDLADRADYARFLSIQFQARCAIEEWAELNCPIDLQPPPQTALIIADLTALGSPTPGRARARFTAAPEGALGVAWALGGSALGNQAMLAGLRKRGAVMPVRFLADEAMPAFFGRLRCRIELPAADCAELGASIAAAHAVFSLFAATKRGHLMKRAA